MRLHPLKARAGFTLIELLVVIAIIAILVAMLLPAVQQVREAARKSQCQDHLHNMGVAIHDYEVTFKVLPPRCTGTGTNTSGQQRLRISGFVSLLPFAEQKPLYDQVKQDDRAPWTNADLYKHNIDLLNCPSDPQGPEPVNGGRYRGITNYAFSGGDNLLRTRKANSAVISDSVVPSRGAFATLYTYAMRDLTDGSSNVILMSERIRPLAADALGNVAQNSAASPAACAAAYNAQTKTLASPFTGDTLPGFRWADGAAFFNGFNTILPPNSASCFSGGAGHWEYGYYTASSRHPGGAQVCMGDAKVTFISENIDAGNQAVAPPGENGGAQSPYGVWGALGTRSSNESVRVP